MVSAGGVDRHCSLLESAALRGTHVLSVSISLKLGMSPESVIASAIETVLQIPGSRTFDDLAEDAVAVRVG